VKEAMMMINEQFESRVRAKRMFIDDGTCRSEAVTQNEGDVKYVSSQEC
jgi:hypothetical protein